VIPGIIGIVAWPLAVFWFFFGLVFFVSLFVRFAETKAVCLPFYVLFCADFDYLFCLGRSHASVAASLFLLYNFRVKPRNAILAYYFCLIAYSTESAS
jgi:hypothetical protein